MYDVRMYVGRSVRKHVWVDYVHLCVCVCKEVLMYVCMHVCM